MVTASASASTTALSADRVAELGYCPPCYAAGTVALVVPGARRCRAHLVDQRLLVEATRAGQARLVAPSSARRRPTYPTGVQTPCVACAAAGVDRLGLPRDGDGSDPLCMPCWRGRTDRRDVADRRRLVVELRERLDDVEPDGCAACGEPDPSPDCWLCGWSWLAQARIDHEQAQAVEAAATAARFAQLAEMTEALERVDELTAWIDRLTETLTALDAGDSWGRPVWLLADLLARDGAARTSRRGRPSALARVGAVLAVNADRRSGRRAMPGRAATAELAGCDSARPVTDAWRRAEALGWCERVEQGRRLSYAERCATGRSQARAVFDIAPLHRGDPAAQAAHIPAALDVLADLLDHARALLDDAQAHVDDLTARAGSWVDHHERIRRQRMRAAIATTRDHARDQATNFRTPHTVSSAMSVHSCLFRGLLISPPKTPASPMVRRPSGRRRIGASRSSTRKCRDLESSGTRSVQRPRTRQGQAGRSLRRKPSWMGWAYPLARHLRGEWVWLRDAPLAQVAATLGAALGPDWTVRDLVAFVDQVRSRPLLTVADRPVAYLRAVLTEVLTGDVAPPHPARRHTEHRRVLVADQATAARQARETAGADHDGRVQAVTVPGRRSAAVEAALAAIRARTPGHLRRADRADLLDITGPDGCDWPQVAQPGAGLPAQRGPSW